MTQLRILMCLALSTAYLLASPAMSQDQGKLPEPDKDAQGKVKKVIEETYKADYKEKSPVKRQAFAQRLLKEGQAVTDDPPTRFVLLREARELAAETGDKTTAFTAIDDIAKTFSTDTLNQKFEALELMTRVFRSPEAPKTISQGYLEITDSAIDADRYDEATNYLKKAMALAAKDPLLAATTTAIQEKQKVVAALRTEYGKVTSSLKALKEKPDDPNAHLVIGKFYCFAKGEWERGFEYLSKADDSALADLVKGERTKPADFKGQFTLASRWAEMAKGLRDNIEKNGARDRALHWYYSASRQADESARAPIDVAIPHLLGAQFKSDGLVFWVEPSKRQQSFVDLMTNDMPKVIPRQGMPSIPPPPIVQQSDLTYSYSSRVKSVGNTGTLIVWAKPFATKDAQPLVHRGPGWGQDIRLDISGATFTGDLKTLPEATPRISTKPVLKDGTWAFGALSWNAQAVSIYANGALQATSPLKGKLVNNHSFMRVGADTYEWLHFDGELGLILFFNRQLTDQEVKTTFDAYRAKFK
jgi:tetratricopeptide (TPR) repeat protein